MIDNLGFISIIVPSYCESSYIRGCLDSLVTLTYGESNYEIIVVDGMSTDGTRDIIEEFSKQYPNLRMLDNPKRTAAAAMNIGIAEAKGKYLARVDAHAEVRPDYLKKCMDVMCRTGADVVGGPIETRGKGFWGKMIAYVLSSLFGVGSSFRTMESYSGYVDTVAFGLYKKSVFHEAGLHDEGLVRGHDWDINQRIIRGGGRIFLDPSIRSVWYCSDGPLKLIKKSFLDGYWIAAIFERHSFRHLIPFFYLISIIALAGFCYFRRSGAGPVAWVYFPLMAYLMIYFGMAFIYSLGMVRQGGWLSLFIGPFLYASFHFSRGLGTLYGMLTGAWLKPER